VQSTFEQRQRAGGPDEYLWHRAGVQVRISVGGNVDVRTPTGAPLLLSFPGANPGSAPLGENEVERKTFYYLGRKTRWHCDAHFAKVRLADIYPGIDLVLISTSGQLEYNFEIRARGDPEQIRIRWQGPMIELDGEGNLVFKSPGTRFIQQQPHAFQVAGNTRKRIGCRYRLLDNSDVALHVDRYDRRSPLLIDPVVIFSTYVGGSGFDAIYAVANDSAGNVYIAGETSSGSLWNNTLPPRSSRDAFVAKLNSNATEVDYTVYLGGSGNDSARALAVDASGNVYVAGVTSSLDFPTTNGAYATSETDQTNVFVTKLNSLGQIQYSTYIGGAVSGSNVALGVDSSGAAYIAGQTTSPAFPVTAGVIQSTFGGGISDCFVTKLNPSGSGLLYSTYLGGSALDACSGIALDSTNNVYVAGVTYSSDFPVLLPLQGLNGTANAFVSKINATGTALQYSTYLGGSNVDQANAIAIDSVGSTYITGSTSSVDFPVTAGVYQSALTGTYNTFVTKMAPNGASLIYSTFIGGSATDAATSIAVGQSGRAILSGYTSSTNYPTVLPIQSTFEGAFDAFATVIDSTGTTIVFSSYFGGAGDDRAYAVGLTGGALYVAGLTASSNFPTQAAIQPGLNVADDGFLLELEGIGANPLLTISETNSGNFTQGQQNATYTVTVSNAANAPPTSGTVTVTEAPPSGLTLVSMSGSGWSCSAESCTRSDALSGGASYPTITVSLDVSDYAPSPEINSVSVLGGGSPPAVANDSTIIVAGGGSDLAQKMAAAQSSTYSAATPASAAVDGNTDGVFSDGSVSSTNYDANAWWEVDLGASATVSSIVVWNRTDCCGNRLSDYWVFVSNTPFLATDTPTTLQNRAGTFSSHQTVQPDPSSTITIPGAQGRYVRVQLSSTNFLTLAEVQVFGSIQASLDLAENQMATQSSTYNSTTPASAAVDGNTDGIYGDGSLAVTNYTANAWWQVDLGVSTTIGSIVVWNRTDCCGSALNDYWVFVSNTPFLATDTPTTLQNRAATFSSHQTVQPNPSSTITIPGAQGRYVRVQLTSTNFLALAEVQVYGP